MRAKGDKNFLFQALLSFSFLKDVIRRSTGSNYPAINSEDLADIKLAIPSLPEQKRIGDLLSSIDGKLESIGRQIEKTKTFKKGLLQQMFV
ncbi:MAG TPA: hypothetical protein DEP46_07430 [Blastocatellia bacterium]|nr:hypothetical protein [Blastocatellia bacterium]